MIVYLLRHERAEANGRTYPNDDRPLDSKGRANIDLTAPIITKLTDPVNKILTSPLKRAAQTAKPLAKELKLTRNLRFEKALLPGAPLKAALGLIGSLTQTKSIIIVGHEPNLSTLAAHLIGSESSSIELKKGSLCKIDCDTRRLCWLVTSKQLRSMAKILRRS